MRQLRNVSVTGVALVKRPANRKPIHLYKNQGGSVPDTTTADAKTPSAESGVLESAAPESVLQAIDGIALSKGEDAAARETLMGIAHLLHNSPNLSMDDLLAAGAAAGLESAVTKAKAKAKDDDAEDEEGEDEDEEGEAEDDAEVGDATDKLPPALRAKAREKQKKSAGESQAKGEAMPADLEKSEQVTITKAEHQVMMQRLEKAEREWKRHESQSILKSIKEENQAALSSLACDHDKLAVIVKAIKDRSPEQATELVGMLKGFDAQVAAAGAAGSSIYKSRAVPNGAAPNTGYSRWQELVKAEAKKSGCTESEATLKVAKTAEATSLTSSTKGPTDELEQPRHRHSGTSVDVDLSDATKPGTFVCVGAAQNVAGYDQGGAAIVGYDSGKTVVGVLLNRPSPNGIDKAANYRVRNVEKVRCGAAWNIGDKIGAMAGGLGSPAGSGASYGVALSSAVVGDLAPVELKI